MIPTFLLRYILPAGAVFVAGLSAGWYAQGVRFDAYKNEQTSLRLEAEQTATKQREELADAWNQALLKVRNDKASYERCVAAGRCGVRVATCGPTLSLPPAKGTDATPADDVLAPEGDATLASDCEVTTLQVLFLQRAIREQKGYE